MEKEKRKRTTALAFFKQHGKLWLLIGGIALGLLLLFVGSNAKDTEKSTTITEKEESLQELATYKAELEKELETLCSAVSGVGQVDVMVRLESGNSIIYASDGSGKPSTVGSGSTQTPLYSTIHTPRIAGVGIVCRGGNDPTIQQKLISLVSTTLDISSSRVFVTGK